MYTFFVFLSSFLLSFWNSDVMSGTPVASLGHEEKVRMTEQKDRTISVIGTAAPALELWAFM